LEKITCATNCRKWATVVLSPTEEQKENGEVARYIDQCLKKQESQGCTSHDQAFLGTEKEAANYLCSLDSVGYGGHMMAFDLSVCNKLSAADRKYCNGAVYRIAGRLIDCADHSNSTRQASQDQGRDTWELRDWIICTLFVGGGTILVLLFLDRLERDLEEVQKENARESSNDNDSEPHL